MPRIRSALMGCLLLVVLALTMTACGSSDDKSSSSSTAAASTTKTSSDSGDSSKVTKDDIDWAVQYTGGTAGKADSSKSPIGLLYYNQQGGTLSFDKVTDAAKAAEDFINNNLGGVQGHPVKLTSCFIQAEEDGQKCATQLLNDDSLKAAIQGTVTVGNASFLNTLKGKKPVFMSAPATGPDLGAKPNAYAWSPGGVALIGAMAVFTAKELQPKTVSLVVTDNAIGKFIGPLWSKIFEGHGGKAKIKSIYLTPTATGPQITSAVQASGASQSDVIVPILVSGTCDAFAKSLQSLGITKQVVGSAGCFAPEILKEGDTLRNGWYFGNWGYVPMVLDRESGTTTYVHVMEQAGLGIGANDGQDRVFATIMTVDKLFNQIGPDGLTTSAIASAVKGFKGPVMMTPGESNCGGQAATPSLCTTEAGIIQYKDGKWLSVAAGAKSIDPNKP